MFVTGHSLRRPMFSVRFIVLKFERGRIFLAKFNFQGLIMPLARLSSGVDTVRPHELAVARG